MKDKLSGIIVVLLIGIIIGISGLHLIKDKPFMMDEDEGHGPQIDGIARGNYSIVEKLSMPPTYHFIIGGLSSVYQTSPSTYRFINLLILIFVLLPVFYILSKYNVVRTLQFFFFPIMFVFYFLVYSDLFSLMLVLLAFLYMKNKRYYLSYFFALFAMLVRQDNFVWTLFFCAYIYIDNNYTLNDFKKYLSTITGYLIGIIILLSYLFYRGKMVMGDNIHHPISFYPSNIWFALFLFSGFLFLPIVMVHYKDVLEYFKTRKKHLLLILGVFLISFLSFSNKHYYNHMEGFWYNSILKLVDWNIYFRIFFSVAICLTVMYLMTIRFEEKAKYLLYPFSVICFSLSLLIDPRYYFIPFGFFMLFRKEESRKVEFSLLVYYMVVSAFFFFTMLKYNKF